LAHDRIAFAAIIRQAALLKGTSKNQEFHTYSRLQKNALRRQRI
jgi:hypothetical protein